MNVIPSKVICRAASIKQISAMECSAPHKMNAGIATKVVIKLTSLDFVLC